MVSRARYSVEYPANFTPRSGHESLSLRVLQPPDQRVHLPAGCGAPYMGRRISGPLLDRIDLQVEVTPVAIGEISQVRPSEPSAAIRERVIRAREVQAERFRGVPGVHTNAMMNARMLREFCPLDQVARELLERAMVRLDLSARAYDRIVKVARTIADLEGRPTSVGASGRGDQLPFARPGKLGPVIEWGCCDEEVETGKEGRIAAAGHRARCGGGTVARCGARVAAGGRGAGAVSAGGAGTRSGRR